MSNKNLTIGLVVAILIAATALFTPGGQPSVTGPTLGNVTNGNYTSYNGLTLDDSTNQLRFGNPSGTGVTNYMSVQRIPITSGTTTPCAILSPSATSTLLSFSIMPTVGTTTASILTIATSSSGFSTSTGAITNVAAYIPTTSFVYNNATTTMQNTANISPSTYVVAGLAAATASGGHVMTGFCTASFLTQ